MIRPPTSAAAALWYAACGWPVFPLHGKHPAIKDGHGCHDATADRETVGNWWQRFPTANVGWALRIGDVPHVVLDDDGGAAEELAATDRPLPATLTQVSRPGRRHYVYAIPPGVEPTGQPDPDLSQSTAQTRVAGFGYIVAEPSRHPTGSTYRWESSLELIAEAPDWLVAHVSAPREAAVQVRPERETLTVDDRIWLELVLDLDPVTRRLYEGRWEELPDYVRGRWSDQTPSAADGSLICRLLRYGADPDRVQRIMRSSGLCRSKFDEPRPGGLDYLSYSVGRLAARRTAP